MNDLTNHIKKLNEKTTAWVAEDPKNRWASMFTEDLEHWTKIGVTTPEEFDKYLLVVDVYELTRSAYGFKPSWSHLMNSSKESLENEIKILHTVLENNAAEVKAARILRKKLARLEELAHKEAVEKAMTPSTGWTIGELELI
jgi:hypothetical protein